MPQERAGDRGATTRRLLGELRPYSGKLVLVFGLVMLGAAAQAGGPWLIGRAIDRYILRGDVAGLSRIMLVLLGVYVVGAIASRGQVYQVGSIGQSLLASMRARIFDRLQHLPLRYFDRRPVGDLMSRVTNDVDTLNQLFSQGLTQLLGSLFSLIGIVVAMLFLDWNLALACFTIIPIMLLLTSFFARRARRAFRLTRETVGDVTAGVQEDIVGVREAQAFNRTEENIARFRRRNAANRDANVQAVAITSAFAPTIDMLSTLATALVIGYGGYLVFAGSLSIGILTAFLIYVQQFFRPIQLASQVYTQAQAAVAGAERIYNILDEAPEPEDPQGRPEARSGHGPHLLRARDLRLRPWPSRPPRRGLPGRARDDGRPRRPDGGRQDDDSEPDTALLRRHGRDGSLSMVGTCRELARKDLRANIGIVLQEPFLFSGTIAENIGYGRFGDPSEATREEVEAAARVVNADDFIKALPEGYDTVLGEGGGALSQGQRQLLSFARAVLTDPRILILDEATSNIDTRTEAIIQKALATLLEGRTSIVIAHRLSTIRNADLILVIEDGSIAERGDHAALLGKNGLYADLYRRQFREPVPSGGRS